MRSFISIAAVVLAFSTSLAAQITITSSGTPTAGSTHTISFMTPNGAWPGVFVEIGGQFIDDSAIKIRRLESGIYEADIDIPSGSGGEDFEITVTAGGLFGTASGVIAP